MLKTNFLQINLLVACRHRPHLKQQLIDASKTEKRVHFLAPCVSHNVKFLLHDWFVRQPSQQTQRDRKGMWFDSLNIERFLTNSGMPL